MERDETENTNGLWDIEPGKAASAGKPGIPLPFILNVIGLTLFTIVFLIYKPFFLTRGYLEPQPCGTPESYFRHYVYPHVIIPTVLYGLIRWIFALRVKHAARTFLIACLLFEMAWLIGSLLQSNPMFLWDFSNRFLFPWVEGHDTQRFVNMAMHYGMYVFLIWGIVSIHLRRIRWTEIMVWMLIILYLAGFYFYFLQWKIVPWSAITGCGNGY